MKNWCTLSILIPLHKSGWPCLGFLWIQLHFRGCLSQFNFHLHSLIGSWIHDGYYDPRQRRRLLLPPLWLRWAVTETKYQLPGCWESSSTIVIFKVNRISSVYPDMFTDSDFDRTFFFFKVRNVLNFEKMGKIKKFKEGPKHLQARDPLLEFWYIFFQIFCMYF